MGRLLKKKKKRNRLRGTVPCQRWHLWMWYNTHSCIVLLLCGSNWTTCPVPGRLFLHCHTGWDGNPHWWPREERGWAHDAGRHGGAGHFKVTPGLQFICRLRSRHGSRCFANTDFPSAVTTKFHTFIRNVELGLLSWFQFVTLKFSQMCFPRCYLTANESVCVSQC